MWGASKGKDKGDKGKDKGDKGKGKGAEGGKAQGHKLQRTRVSAEKFVGTVSVWKGKYGFIQPAEEIAHEKAKLHNGALFVSMDDVPGNQELETGAPVEFHIFEDSSGLGAEEVVQTGPGTGKGPVKGGAKGGVKGGKDSSWKGGKDAWSCSGGGWDGGKAAAAGWQASAKGYGGKGAGYGGMSVGYGGKGAGYGGKDAGYGGKGAVKGWGPSTVKGAWADPYGKGSGGWMGGMDKGKGKGKSKEGGKGHLLPRTRVTAEKFLGTVTTWKGKYGWITPVEEIHHEKAKMHNGGIFCSTDDLVGRTDLTQGATVQFHISEDSSGLRAEEVVQS